MNQTYLRGDLYYADLGKGVGSEQEGYRPVVIIQNDTGNRYSPTVIVAAISSKVTTKAKLPTHYYLAAENGLKLPSIVLSEQLRTIDKRRLTEYIGHISELQMREIDKTLSTSIGLNRPKAQFTRLCLCVNCAHAFFGKGAASLRQVAEPGKEGLCISCGEAGSIFYDVIVKGCEQV